ncbi:serine/threonine-protein kinase [Proteus mirabilis]|uniref:serine/threonine-protein kinase n=1 Tax=Proteus mirabilis TaxID=584 RepID=UPI0029DF6E3C|nr:serine/threonine protein kinase [Proteus mirabilis]HEK1146850.1 serine/threonine protein kinase [Proteus mirabilis]HEK1986946.1 serine/threonine protein kinase [Proteus mirabilis]
MITSYRKADISFKWIKDLEEQGCFSRVYLAHDENLDHDLVIKEIKKSESKDKDIYFSEARLLYKNAHPNIVQVQYAAEDDDNIYIAMPYYYNGTINQRLKRENLTPNEIIRYAIQFISGLNHIHTNGLIHFDIKPNNIMLSNRDEAMISDFGLSKLVNDSNRAKPDDSYLLHSPPEWISSNNECGYNYTYDIYQVGVALYRMCIGAAAFDFEFRSHVTPNQLARAIARGEFPSQQYPAHIPKALRNIIKMCLHVDPNDRYQSVLDILNALSSIKNGENLDWRMDHTCAQNTCKWTKNTSNAILSLEYDAGSKTTLAKRIYSDGKTRKENKLCLTDCNQTKLYSLLKDS